MSLLLSGAEREDYVTPEQLMNLVREVGDLREAIGAERARLQASEAKLASKEKELEAALNATGTKASQSAMTTRRAQGVVFERMRTGSVPTQVVNLLESRPSAEFTIAEIAEAVGKPVRRMYGALGRMVTSKKITRVRDGVFRARRHDALKLAEG